MKRKLALITVIACSLAYTVGLACYATSRPVDGDEGYYATAARLVWEGKAPYRDFFYQQAPAMPYLYSWVWGVHPDSLVALRMLSAACGGLAILVWGLLFISEKRMPVPLALGMFAAVLLNPYWVSWHVVVKTYAAANLLFSITTICLYRALRLNRRRWYLFAGLALGLCTSVRSLYGLIIPAILIWLLHSHREKFNFLHPNILAFLGGAVVGLVPVLISFLRDPHAFIFNNIRYHSLDAGYMWLDGKLFEGYHSVGHISLLFFAHAIGLFVFHPYFTIETVLAVVGLVSWLRLRNAKDSPYIPEDNLYLGLAGIMLITYTATALVPFPPYEQYFDSPLVPFLIPFVVEGLRATLRRGRRWAVVLPALAIFLFWAEIPRESAWNSNAPEWQMKSYESVAATVAANSSKDEVVLSFWPGYILESGRRYWPGLEDNFTFRITNKISSQERSRYHVASADEVVNAIVSREVGMVVIAPRNVQKEFYQDLSESQLKILQTALATDYSLIGQMDDVQIYRRRADGN